MLPTCDCLGNFSKYTKMCALVGIQVWFRTKKLNPGKLFCMHSLVYGATYFLVRKSISYQSKNSESLLTRHLYAPFGSKERPGTRANQLVHKKETILIQNLNATRLKMKRRMGEIIERENILTIPNVLCATRIVLSPIIGHLIMQENFSLAFYLTLFAGITDLLDGVIARSYENQSSKLGSFLDPMADKILISAMFLSLTYVELMPVLITSIIIGRDLVLAAAGFYIRYKSLPPPRTFSRYFDATHATAQLAPTYISKVNTIVQLFAVATTLAAPVMDFVGHPLIYYLWCLTGGSTIASAVSYILLDNTYIVLKRENN